MEIGRGGVGKFQNQAKNGILLWKYSPKDKKLVCLLKLDTPYFWKSVFTYSITLNEV